LLCSYIAVLCLAKLFLLLPYCGKT
jgi:hypothetical protein